MFHVFNLFTFNPFLPHARWTISEIVSTALSLKCTLDLTISNPSVDGGGSLSTSKLDEMWLQGFNKRSVVSSPGVVLVLLFKKYTS